MATYAKVRRMRLREGLSISEIARRTSLSRNTIKAWLRASTRSEMSYRREAGPKKLDGHREWLRQALEIDARRPRKERRTALRLFAQLQAEGFDGSYTRCARHGPSGWWPTRRRVTRCCSMHTCVV